MEFQFNCKKNGQHYLTASSFDDDYRSDISKINDYFALDVETTGLSPSEQRIIEIGIVHYCSGAVVSSFSTLVNPRCHIPSHVSEINGIYDADVADAPSYDDIALRIANYINGAIVVGHNIARFDLAFLRSMFDETKTECSVKYIDTLTWARRLMPGIEKYSLDRIASAAGILIEEYHRAEADANTSSRLFEYLKISYVDKLEREKAEIKARKAAAEERRKRLCSSSPLFDANFVFTGHFPERDMLEEQVQKVGAFVKGSISSKTNFLVPAPESIDPGRSSNKKYRMALVAISEGQDIKIISPDECLELVNAAMPYIKAE